MLVSDIYPDAREVLSYGDQDLILSRISDAVDRLNNEGNFDALLGYLTIVPTGDRITLPPDVNVPLKVNVDDKPAFGRDRLYEFTQNGPGSNAPIANWNWIDRGRVPVINQPTTPDFLTVIGATADNDKEVRVTGRTDNQGTLDSVVLTIGSVAPTTPVFQSIQSVVKDVTTRPVSLLTGGGQILASYRGGETEPQYRQIRISPSGGVAYIQFRATTFRVSALTDTIPIRSRMGLLLTIKSNEALRREQFDTAKNYMTEAVDIAKKEQAASNSFVDVAQASEKASILGLNYNNADSVIVADIYDEASEILGPVGQQKVFDNIAEARSILSRKGQWDAFTGYVDINTDQYHYVTLPRYVDQVIRLRVNNRPAMFRNKWFQFGLDANCGFGWGEWCRPTYAEEGEVVTLRDVPYQIKLQAVPNLTVDDGGIITVYGFVRGEWITTQNDDGSISDGFQVVMDSTGATESDVLVDRITRITKTLTKGYVTLSATDTLGQQPFNVGFYYPDETEPRYRRIKLSQTCAQIRIMYRLRAAKITSLTDPLHLKSKRAITCMLNALKMQYTKPDDAEKMEVKATQYLAEEQAVINRNEGPTIEADPSFSLRGKFVR